MLDELSRTGAVDAAAARPTSLTDRRTTSGAERSRATGVVSSGLITPLTDLVPGGRGS